jgi:phosphatase NudJ
MSHSWVRTWGFVLIVVRLGRRFLLTQETKHEGWYLPAGRVEPGESLAAAAVRETLEETGIPVVLEGVARIEHTPQPGGDGARLRVFYIARPADDREPKLHADEHSRRAWWVTLDEVRELKLRGPEVLEVLESVAGGAPIYPLSLIRYEGDPWPRG